MELLAFPMDLLGQTDTNFIRNEYHDLSSYQGNTNRIIVLNQGPFFAKDLTVRGVDGTPLLLGTDYRPIRLNQKLTAEAGIAVYNAIAVTNPRVSDEVYVDAQYVGGPYTRVGDDVMQLLKDMTADTRDINWYNLTDKPAAYKPSGHLHPLWELYGFGPYTSAIEKAIDGELLGSRASLDDLRQVFSDQHQALAKRYDALEQKLTSHTNDYGNPHRTTKDHLSLAEIQNYPPPTYQEAVGETSSRTYATTLRLKEQFDHFLTALLETHTADVSDPHNTTPGQLGTYSRSTIRDRFASKYTTTAQVANSEQFDGLSYNQARNEFRRNLDASNIEGNRLAPQRLGGGTATQDTVLMGGGQWRSISDLVDEHTQGNTKVLYIGFQGRQSDAVNHIRSTYTDIDEYPVGTIIIYREDMKHMTDVGNGAAHDSSQVVYSDTTVMDAMMRTSSGWSTMGGDNLDKVHWAANREFGDQTAPGVIARGNANANEIPYS